MRLFAAAHDGEEEAETRKPVDPASQGDGGDQTALQKPTRQFRGQRIDTPSRPGVFESAFPLPVCNADLHPGHIQTLARSVDQS